jgi:hypothetical protein
MLVISEAEAAAIRATYEQRGEFSAAVEVRPARLRVGKSQLMASLGLPVKPS